MRLLLVACLVACATRAPATTTAPAFAQLEAASDIDGTVVGPSDARATIVIVFASWCGHCRDQLEVIASVRAAHPETRVLGVNYRGHEEYDGRGNADAVRAYVARSAPWLRVVPAGDALFAAFGKPAKVPTIYVFDRAGVLAETYDRRERAMPDATELASVLQRLGAR